MRLFSRSGTALCCVTLLLSGCGIPISTMHGPTPTPANTSRATVGFAPVFLDDAADEDFLLFSLIFGGFASVRKGVTERLEIGGSMGIFNGITAEAKYNLIPGPLYVSANLAASIGILFDVDIWGSSDGGAAASVGLHPALLVGTERVYGGGKLLAFPFNPYVQRPWTVLFAGGSFGGRTRFVPEIAWMRDPADGETAWVAGVGLQRQRNARILQ